MPATTHVPARERAQLTCTDIRVERGGNTVLSGVGMNVSPRSRWGIVGENGRGKSTLLHILAGSLAPDGVTVAGRLHQPATLSVTSGDRLIVTGPNGAGKSTLTEDGRAVTVAVTALPTTVINDQAELPKVMQHVMGLVDTAACG
ncbi:ATP-binding cassette domain-containing protein [Streptomyces antimycoticus]